MPSNKRCTTLIRLLSNERNKNAGKIEKLLQGKKEALGGEIFRLYGELITANFYQMEKGQQEVSVLNYYEEDTPLITISLDPSLTPSENAQAYFKKYNKAKNSLNYIDEQVEIAQREVDYLDAVLHQLGSAGLKDLEEIQDELIEEGYLKKKIKKGCGKIHRKSPL